MDVVEIKRCRLAKHLFLFLIVISGQFACSSTRESNPQPLRIVPLQKLSAQVGEQVRWDFKVFRGDKAVELIGIDAAKLPFGVVQKVEGQKVFFEGKVLGREIRHGFIKVTGFDKEGCDAEFSQTKLWTLNNAVRTGSNEAAVPADPCNLAQTGARQPTNHMVEGLFEWFLVDGIDSLGHHQNVDFIRSIADDAMRPVKQLNRRNHQVKVPFHQALHTFFTTLGSCAELPRTRCGDKRDCLWQLNTCITNPMTSSETVGGMTPR